MYRPITLLPASLRLLLKVVDMKFRSLIEDGSLPIPIEQGGFLKKRNTALQAFLLKVLRDHARKQGRALYVAFLDLYKAFDTISHVQLLEVLRSLNIPPALVDVVHRLLPGFYLSLYGVEFLQEGGTFQGGPLSPLLCVLFLVDLILYLNGDSGSAFHGVAVPWDPTVIQAAIKLLLFADDIVLLATTIDQLQLALDLVLAWAARRQLILSIPKCEVMRLSRSRADRRPNAILPPVFISGHPLSWVLEKKYLGFMMYAAPDPPNKYRTKVPLDPKDVRKLTGSFFPIFRSSSRQPQLAPKAVIRGIHQVIHFKFLYPTCLIDTDYNVLDVQVHRCLRFLFGVPHCSSTTLLAADLGIWPSIYYAHERSLMFLWSLRHDYWTKDVFSSWMPTPDATPPLIDMVRSNNAVMTRFHRILLTYDLSWTDLNESAAQETWRAKVMFGIRRHFSHSTRAAARRHGHPYLEYHIPREFPTASDFHDTLTVPRLHHILDFPPDLVCAAIRFRNSRLRLLPSYDRLDHGQCRFCLHAEVPEPGPENGYHLMLQCLHLPPPTLRDCRDALLKDISQDLGLPPHDPSQPHRRLVNSLGEILWPPRLFRSDRLPRFLAMCRSLLNAYAAFQTPMESPLLRAYPVRPCRPRIRNATLPAHDPLEDS